MPEGRGIGENGRTNPPHIDLIRERVELQQPVTNVTIYWPAILISHRRKWNPNNVHVVILDSLAHQEIATGSETNEGTHTPIHFLLCNVHSLLLSGQITQFCSLNCLSTWKSSCLSNFRASKHT